MNASPDSHIDRREFLARGAGASLAAAGLPTAAVLRPDPARSPAAAKISARLAERQLDSRDFTLSEYSSVQPAFAFSATNPVDAAAWRSQAREQLVTRLGGFPERVPLAAEVVERVEMDGYSRETILFQTRHNLTAIGYLLVPAEVSEPLPAVICIPGHGRGVDDIVGIDEAGRQRTERTGYARDFAIQVVERGHVAFAVEPLGFGHRRDDAARASGPNAYSCRPAAGAAMLFGGTMVGWRVWDVLRSLDYLEERPEADESRVAVMGISGGGTVALFAGAVDERIAATVVSCYFNTFRDSIVPISHCLDNYIPGLLLDMEMYDVAGLVAPRALFLESGDADRIFPVEGARAAYDHARRIFAASGAQDRLDREIFAGGHEFHGVGAFAFLERVL